jgi:hypothetical protein
MYYKLLTTFSKGDIKQIDNVSGESIANKILEFCATNMAFGIVMIICAIISFGLTMFFSGFSGQEAERKVQDGKKRLAYSMVGTIIFLSIGPISKLILNFL